MGVGVAVTTGGALGMFVQVGELFLFQERGCGAPSPFFSGTAVVTYTPDTRPSSATREPVSPQRWQRGWLEKLKYFMSALQNCSSRRRKLLRLIKDTGTCRKDYMCFRFGYFQAVAASRADSSYR